MAWTAPKTWTAATLTAADLNAQIRDNLLACAPSIVAGERGYVVSTGLNKVDKRRTFRTTLNETATTTSLSYTDDADSVGPSLTVDTNTSVLVIFGAAQHLKTGGPASTFTSVEVSGATTIAASNGWCLRKRSDADQRFAAAQFVRFSTLTPGDNTFKMKYQVGAGTGVFFRRRLMVMPLN